MVIIIKCINKCYKIIPQLLMSGATAEQKQTSQQIQNGQSIENQFFSEPMSQVSSTLMQKQFDQNLKGGMQTPEKQQNINIFQRQPKPKSREIITDTQRSNKDNHDVPPKQVQNNNTEKRLQNSNMQKEINQQVKAKFVNSSVKNQHPSTKTDSFVKNSIIERKPIIDPQVLEAKIKEIAQTIRNKVKKDEQHVKQKEQMGLKKVLKIKGKEQILSPLKLTPLPNDKNSSTVTYVDDFSQIKLLTFQDNITVDINPLNSLKFIKNLLKKQVLEKVFLQIEMKQKIKKQKLKLDPINHHYPITSFRKSIISQLKQHTLRQLQKQKDRQSKLNKRREIYKSSRYQRYTKMGSILQRSLYQEVVKESLPSISHENPQLAQPSANDFKGMKSQQEKQTTAIEKQKEIQPKTKVENEGQGYKQQEWDYQ